MIVISFDPSMNNWGYAVCKVDTNLVPLQLGVISVVGVGKSTTHQFIDHARQLHEKINSLINLFEPSVIVAETPTGSQSFASAKSMALCNTLLGTIAASHKVILLTPQQLKNIVGSPTATKQDVINWVVNNYPKIKLPVAKSVAEHMCDALLAAHTAKHLNLLELSP